MVNNKSRLRLLANFVVRLVLYAWFATNFLLRMRGDESWLLVFSVMVAIVSVIMTLTEYDKKLALRVILSKKMSIIFFVFLLLIWLQVLVEWVLSLDGAVTHESYLYYEPILTLLGAPSSLFVVMLDVLFDFKIGEYSTLIHVMLTWVYYFGAAVLQYLLLFKVMKSTFRKSLDIHSKE